MNPINDNKDPPDCVKQRHQSSHWRREQRQAADYVLGQDLEGEQEQVRGRRTHRVLVPSGEATQHVSKRQEQPHGCTHHHVQPEQLAPMEDLLRARADAAVGWEGQARECQEIRRCEGREDQVQEWDQTASREHHYEGHQLELYDTQRPHYASDHRLLVRRCRRRWMLLLGLRLRCGRLVGDVGVVRPRLRSYG